MQSFGGFLFLMGVGSFALGFLGYEFGLLMWIDNWGVDTGNLIRVGMAVVGGGMWLAGRERE